MPLQIENNYDQVSLNDLVRLREQGYSVLKSPHVGNQHRSNLACAKLGIPLEMVSFTQGERDTNFHPQVRIEDGVQTSLYDARVWTQFASVPDGRSATEYHQSAVQEVFPQTEILTDVERMRQYPALAATVLRATNIKRSQSVWYRRVSEAGHVTNRSTGLLTDTQLETEVFQFSNDHSGWVIPNKVHIIFDLAYQALASGRSTVYHLSGPQMVHYVDSIASELELLYDAVRLVMPDLPLVLKVRIVPVAAAQFVTTSNRKIGLDAFAEVRTDLQYAAVAAEFVTLYPEFTTPIESGTTLSQYDLTTADDLLLDPWMLEASLAEVTRIYNLLIQTNQSRIAAE